MIDILRADYYDAIEQIRIMKADVNELANLLCKHSVEIPNHIQERIQQDDPLD